MLARSLQLPVHTPLPSSSWVEARGRCCWTHTPSTLVNTMDSDHTPVTPLRATPSPQIVERDLAPNGGGVVELCHRFINYSKYNEIMGVAV